MTDTSSKTLDNLTRLVKLVACLFVVNILMIWYAVYELRTYRQSTKLLRSGVEFVETENRWRFTELTRIMKIQEDRANIKIDNNGVVNFKAHK